MKTFKAGLACLLAAALIVPGFASCSDGGGDFVWEGKKLFPFFFSPGTGGEPSAAGENAENGLDDLAFLASEKWKLNSDTVGWLRVPGTAIDDVVLWKKGDNDYYLRRNFEKRYYNNGVYYADQNCTFGEGGVESLSKNTVIYGHSLSDSKNDVQFGPMRCFLEEDFARGHPYIFFSTLTDNLAWEVIAVYYANYNVPYNSNALNAEEFAAMLEEVRARSLFLYEYEPDPTDRFLTLSTCVYSLPESGPLPYPNEYRLGITARLVNPGEELKDEAVLTRNPNVKPA